MNVRELDVIDAVVAAATPGPWKFAAWGDEGNHTFDVHAGAYRIAWELQREDAAFIAAARGWVPNLVAEVRRMRAVADEMGDGVSPECSLFADRLLSTEPICEYEGCEKCATTVVRWVLGTKTLCPNHAHFVRGIEREWDEAEAEYLEQNL